MFLRLRDQYWDWRARRKFPNSPKSRISWKLAKKFRYPIQDVVLLEDEIDYKGVPNTNEKE